MSATISGPNLSGSQGRDETSGRSLLPAIRRVMQVGSGPPALKNWLQARGISLTPRPEWTPADERAARSLAQRLNDVVGPNAVAGRRLAPLTHQPQETLRTVELRIEGL